VRRQQNLLRFGVAGVLTLASLIVGGTLMRRGLSAANEASAILEDARGVGGPAAGDERWRARVGVILLVLAVALAFLASALLIVAKPLWF
jgi:hypothetical protein